MKKLIALFSLVFVLFSCSLDDNNNPNVRYELLKTEEVTIPDVFILGDTAEILVRYKKPSSCHGFDGFYYDKDGFTRTIAVQNYVIEDPNCQNLTDEIKQETLRFQPTATGMYTFKFWTGKDANGVNTYLEFEREVITN
jgi:hypothetical protein